MMQNGNKQTVIEPLINNIIAESVLCLALVIFTRRTHPCRLFAIIYLRSITGKILRANKLQYLMGFCPVSEH